MRLSSLLGCRRRTSRPAGLVGRPHRPGLYCPRLEVLEDRLPPGDVSLGALVGSGLWGPSLSAKDSEPWTPEGTSAGSLLAGLREAGPGYWTATMSGSLAAESVLTTADHPAEQPRREGGETGSETAPLLAGGIGDGLPGSGPALFDGDALFASALTDSLPGSGAQRGGGAATSAEPVLGSAQGGGEATGGGGAAASPNGAAGASAGPRGVAQPLAPAAAGASSSLAALSSYAGLPGALPQPGANTARLGGALPQPSASPEGPAGATSAAAAACDHGPAVHATFDLSAPAGAAFPSDRFTVADASNLTGLRVNLPLPDLTTNPSDHYATQVINTLDGFNLQPRLSIPFDGPIDVGVNSVNSQDVFLINLGDTVDHLEHGDHIVGINQVVWDPATNTLHAESDQLLDQHTRYALIVTNGVRDADGQPVQASEDFTRFRHDLNFGQTQDPGLKEYRKDLLDATAAAAQVGVPERAIVTASVFTTESATAVLEKIRDQIHAATPAPADFNLGSNGERTGFSLDGVTKITFNQQTSVTGPLVPTTVNLSLLKNIVPGAVGEVAFGKYLSPDYEVHPGGYIPPVATRTGTPVVQGTNEIYFNLFLPSGPKPPGGWPVAIHGIGANGNKQRDLFVVATMAQQGIATLIINTVSRGFGPRGTLKVDQTGGVPSVTLPAGGRGIDQNGDGLIGVQEGQNATGTSEIIGNRDAQRQTAADLMQLVQVIKGGMAVHGDRFPDLDPFRISYFGWSLGANIGTDFLAVEPSVQAGALYSLGGPIFENGRLSPGNRSSGLGTSLKSQMPSLINSPGINSLDRVSLAGTPLPLGPFFNENLPLRDGISEDGTVVHHPLTVGLTDGTTSTIQSPVINTVAGANAIQEYLEKRDWVNQSGNQVAYAPHLRRDPLPGVPAKSILILFGKGDEQAPNPNATAMLRAGDLADRATFFRNDLAFAEDPAVPQDPHPFVNNIDASDPLVAAIARGAQSQIAVFLATSGTVVIQPEPSRFFETPIQGPLPEDLNFIP